MNKYIKMRCENCGAEMEVDQDKRMIYCPYCGSKTLVEESDEVKKAKLDSATRIHEADKNAEISHDKLNADISEARNKTLQSIFGDDNLTIISVVVLIIVLLYFSSCVG